MKETFMYNFQHAAKFEELKIREKMSFSLQNTDSKTEKDSS